MIKLRQLGFWHLAGVPPLTQMVSSVLKCLKDTKNQFSCLNLLFTLFTLACFVIYI